MKNLPLMSTILLVSFSLASSKWDGLRLRFDQDTSKAFIAHPRTVSEATAQGFVPVGNDECNESPNYNGRAYVKDSDYSVTLLYDVNGFIAGIQAGIPVPASQSGTYPGANARPPLVLDGISNTLYIITVYFTVPSKICTIGRNQSEFDSEGTGTGLWLQYGTGPTNVDWIPDLQSLVCTPWMQGKCFPAMGMHYWYNITTNMNCDDIVPMFLLYNGGKLNAFGWAFPITLSSPNFEHPPPMVYPLFFEDVPPCLFQRNISTLHVYLTDVPARNAC